jgi:hypothetical protein
MRDFEHTINIHGTVFIETTVKLCVSMCLIKIKKINFSLCSGNPLILIIKILLRTIRTNVP